MTPGMRWVCVGCVLQPSAAPLCSLFAVQVLVEVAAVSHAHSVAVIAEAFSSGIAALPSGTSKELRAVLARLAQLFTLYHVERGAVDLLESGYMNASQVKLARSEVQ